MPLTVSPSSKLLTRSSAIDLGGGGLDGFSTLLLVLLVAEKSPISKLVLACAPDGVLAVSGVIVGGAPKSPSSKSLGKSLLELLVGGGPVEVGALELGWANGAPRLGPMSNRSAIRLLLDGIGLARAAVAVASGGLAAVCEVVMCGAGAGAGAVSAKPKSRRTPSEGAAWDVSA